LLPDDCDHLGGLDPQLQQLWEAAALPLAAPKWAPARGALLTGDPGTGKTAAVRWLAKKLRNVGHVIVRKAADCLGRFHGDAERELQSVFHEAGKLAPCVVFFDEIDALASSRSNNNQQGSQKGTVATMLSLLDSLPSQVAVIAATCRPADVDAALRRPGRLDREIHFSLPSTNCRAECLRSLTSHWPGVLGKSTCDGEGYYAAKPSMHWLAERAVGMTGSHLKSMCTRAVLNACKRSSSPNRVFPCMSDLQGALESERKQMLALSGSSCCPEDLPATLSSWLNQYKEATLRQQCSLICNSGGGTKAIAALERAILHSAASVVDVGMNELLEEPAEAMKRAIQTLKPTQGLEAVLRLPPLEAWAISSHSDEPLTTSRWQVCASALSSMLISSLSCQLVARCDMSQSDLPKEVEALFSQRGTVVDVVAPCFSDLVSMAFGAVDQLCEELVFARRAAKSSCHEDMKAGWYEQALADVESEEKCGHEQRPEDEDSLIKQARMLRVKSREGIKAAAVNAMHDGHFAAAQSAFESRTDCPGLLKEQAQCRRGRKRRWAIGDVVEIAAKGHYTNVSDFEHDLLRHVNDNREELALAHSCECAVVDLLLNSVQKCKCNDGHAEEIEEKLSHHSASEKPADRGKRARARESESAMCDSDPHQSALIGKLCVLRDSGEEAVVAKASASGHHCVRVRGTADERWIDVRRDVEQWILQLASSSNRDCASASLAMKEQRRNDVQHEQQGQPKDATWSSCGQCEVEEDDLRRALKRYLEQAVHNAIEEAREAGTLQELTETTVDAFLDRLAWARQKLEERASPSAKEESGTASAELEAKRICIESGVSILNYALSSALV
jgi:hypothetical protein